LLQSHGGSGAPGKRAATSWAPFCGAGVDPFCFFADPAGGAGRLTARFELLAVDATPALEVPDDRGLACFEGGGLIGRPVLLETARQRVGPLGSLGRRAVQEPMQPLLQTLARSSHVKPR